MFWFLRVRARLMRLRLQVQIMLVQKIWHKKFRPKTGLILMLLLQHPI